MYRAVSGAEEETENVDDTLTHSLSISPARVDLPISKASGTVTAFFGPIITNGRSRIR